MIGRRYFLPCEVNAALEQVFTEPLDRIVVLENSLYARAPWHARHDRQSHPARLPRRAICGRSGTTTARVLSCGASMAYGPSDPMALPRGVCAMRLLGQPL